MTFIIQEFSINVHRVWAPHIFKVHMRWVLWSMQGRTLGVLWAYLINTNVLSYIRYVHYVYATAFYIQKAPFLGKTSIVWHFMPKYHITENITCSWVTKYVLIRRRTNTTRSSRHANKLQYSVEVALTFASGNSHHTKTWVATEICWQSHPMSMKETMSTLSGTNGHWSRWYELEDT